MTGVPFSEPPGEPGGVVAVLMCWPRDRRLKRSADGCSSSCTVFSSIETFLGPVSASLVE